MRSASRTDWKARELDDKLRQKRRDAAKRGRTVLQAAMEPALADATGGWVEVAQEEDGSVYYYNEVTGVTSWDRPAELGGSIAAAPAAAPTADVASAAVESAAPLAEGWEVAVSPEDGTYYFNSTTQQTSWDHPGYSAAAGNVGGDLFRAMLATSAPAAEAAADPYEWVKTEDPNSGVPYWYRTATGETTWNDPNVARAESGAAEGATYAAAPIAVERPPTREGAIALVDMSAQQVQYLLRFHLLVALLQSFIDAGVDGAMLNDMVTIEDVDEIVPKLRVRKKKLLRVLAAARSEGVALEDLDAGQPTAAAAAEVVEEEEVVAVTGLDAVDAALVVRMTESPPEGPCLIGSLACVRHNAVISSPGTLGLELCTVLILKSKRVLVEVKNVKPGSVMEAFDVKADDWLEVIDGVNVDLMGGLDVTSDGRISLEELHHIRARIDELGRAAGRRGPPRQHLPGATELLNMYDVDHDGTLDLAELYNLIDGPFMSRIVGLLGARPLTLSFARRTPISNEAVEEAVRN